MRAYIVTVRPGTSDRYTDTIWISQEKAEQRVCDLIAEFQRRGKLPKNESVHEGWAAWTSEAEIEDATLGAKK
jgi:hypothetical protein